MFLFFETKPYIIPALLGIGHHGPAFFPLLRYSFLTTLFVSNEVILLNDNDFSLHFESVYRIVITFAEIRYSLVSV